MQKAKAMIVSNTLAFIELHKTGCTHIGNLLVTMFGCIQRGKHNPPPPALLRSERKILGSVRNPWDWYVSLWAYGCDKKGLVYNLSTQAITPNSNDQRPAKNPKKWKDCYTDVNDASAFQMWLQMMNDENYWNDFGEGYGYSPVAQYTGLLTYRYLNLFCHRVASRITSAEDIKVFEEKNCFINNFIRMENLEDDFIAALQACNIEISKKQKREIYSIKKTNTSSRKAETAYYYDDASIQLISERESIIIDKFSYQAPII